MKISMTTTAKPFSNEVTLPTSVRSALYEDFDWIKKEESDDDVSPHKNKECR